MRKIAIIGAGQCGLHLGFGLLKQNCKVQLYTDRSPEQLRNGRLMASPILFNPTLELERELGLNFWDHQAPFGEGINVDFRKPNGETYMTIRGSLGKQQGQAIDQRFKYARWIEEFEHRGGDIIFENVSLDRLEEITANNDLTLIAVGKGDITKIFERDDQRSVHKTPPRKLAAMLVKGPKLIGDQPFQRIPFRPLWFNIIDDVGGLFSLPFYSDEVGECRSLMFEALPEGPMDVFDGATSGDELLARGIDIIKQYIPDDAHHIEGAELIDDRAWLNGSYVPIVRKPVGKLPSGNSVMLVGDTVVLNDPYTGQGANNASHMANVILKNIRKKTDNDFGDHWITDVFEESWNSNGRYATEFTNAMMDKPLPGMMEIVGAATQHPQIADMFIQNFADPIKFWPWIEDAEAARKVVEELLG